VRYNSFYYNLFKFGIFFLEGEQHDILLHVPSAEGGVNTKWFNIFFT